MIKLVNDQCLYFWVLRSFIRKWRGYSGIYQQSGFVKSHVMGIERNVEIRKLFRKSIVLPTERQLRVVCGKNT